MIIGTAGHIDHGKTTLVRALTGVDTDRLKEEKARGISIELGYAYVAFEGGVLGFVDVPGHERLIHTMVAGACGIDYVLLVIAADDGIMPQTREHLAIIELLGIARGAVVLTKCDRVEPARARQVREEVGAWLKDGVFDGAPIFQVCAGRPDDPGIAALDAHLRTCALDEHARARSHSTEACFRFPIDRVFTLSGAGTVVTGTVFGGSIRVGDTVWLVPRGTTARVRSLHAYNREAEAAYAGDRCALNLAGVSKEQIARGDWVACERMATVSQRLDVELTLFDDAQVGVRHETRVHVHLGTMHHVARAVLIEDRQPERRNVRMQFVFDEPVCAIAGDRFIVRDAQAAHTVGGGRVLDPFGPERKRRSPQRIAWLDALTRWLDTGRASAVIEQAPYGVRRSLLERVLGMERTAMKLTDAVAVIPIRGEGGDDDWLVEKGKLASWSEEVVDALRRFHEGSPDELGIDSGRLRRITAPAMEEGLWRALLEHLIQDGSIKRSGSWLHLPGHAVVLSDEERRCAERALALLKESGIEPLWVRDLASAINVPEEQARALLRKLARCGEVYQVVRDLFYHPDALCEVAKVVERVALAGEGKVTAAAFRDATGIGRKRAIQVLEFFDRVGYTRFCHDAHLLRESGRFEARF